MAKLKVLSLFDGISCAQLALKGLGHEVTYYASEIDKYAIEVTQRNHPNTTHLGDIQKISIVENSQDFKKYIFYGDGHQPAIPLNNDIDLLIGGSPCQDLSIAKKNREGLAGKRSGLFYEYVRLLKEIKPKYFILENVASMPKEAQEEISKELGVQPVMINAALVSAQNRKRLFWVGKLEADGTYNQVPVPLPEDRNIFLKDILLDGETEDLKSLCITATYHKKNERDFLKKNSGQMIRIGDIGSNAQAQRVYSPEGKSVALSAQGGGQGAKTGLYLIENKKPAKEEVVTTHFLPEAERPKGNYLPRERVLSTEGKFRAVSTVSSQQPWIIQRPRGKNKGNIHTEKSPTLTTSSFEHNNHLQDGTTLRKLHPIECERLQGVPDDYTIGSSNTQRYKMLGNAFNVEVIKHILSHLKW